MSGNISSSIVLATTWHDPSRRKLEAVRACTERDVPTLLSLLTTYLGYRGRKGIKTSSNTIAYYNIALRDWIQHCWPKKESSPQIPLLRATRDDIERYIAILQQEGGHLAGSQSKELSVGSVATYLSGIRAFYKALIWAEALTKSPAQEVRSPIDPRPNHEKRPALPIAEYQRLIEYVQTTNSDQESNSNYLRFHAMLRLMGDQGLRISELVSLTLLDIDMYSGIIFIKNAKGGKSRTIPMTKATHQALTIWLEERSKHAALEEKTVLVNIGKKVKKDRQGKAMHPNTVRLQLEKLYKEAGISPRYKGAHILRHTAGTRLYRKTRDLYRVAQVLGHSDVNTSSIYAKMDIEGIREAMESLDE